jgi:hypothetical protein
MEMQQAMILIIASTGGALLTFFLQKMGLSVVVSSSLVGLTGALIAHFAGVPHLAAVIFAGSFAGMTGTSVGSYPLIILAGLLVGVFYLISLKIFAGFGGRLGTIAFVSSVTAFYVVFFAKKGFEFVRENNFLGCCVN